MPTWTCPTCDRRFGRRNQSHECAPRCRSKLRDPDDVDDQVLAWLTDAYLSSPD